MEQLTSTDLIKILGHVTLILVIPILGGVVLGILLDKILNTSPAFVSGLLVVGNIIAIVSLVVYIRVHTRKRA